MMKSFLRAGALWLFILLLLASRSAGPAYAQSSSDANFLASLDALRDASFEDKDAIIDKLIQSGHPNAQAILTAFLEDRLYFRNDDMKVFLLKTAAADDTTTLDLIDPVTLKSAGSASVDNVTKIGTNNHLRRTLKTALARFALSSPDAKTRLAAARDIEQDLDESNVQMLRERSGVETDPNVKNEIAIGLALATLDGSDTQARIAAISTLRHSLRQDVLNKLQGLVAQSSDGTFAESDENVRRAAASAVEIH